jgi:glycosyltransferase involved in cell wall biosynthesis
MKPQRILIVTKFAHMQGGVEQHVETLAAELARRGREVARFTSEDLPDSGGSKFRADASTMSSKAQGVGTMFWSFTARRELQRRIEGYRPDLIHYHSIYHQLSPSVLLNGGHISVMTLHDFKLAAPCYTLVRDGDVCTACVGKRFPVDSIRFGCIRDSKIKSFLCAAEAVVHGPVYRNVIDQFIVPSSYAKGIATQAGLPAHKISVVRWGVDSAHRTDALDSEEARRPYLFFGGRLEVTKGIDLVLDLWYRSSLRDSFDLIIAGDGSLSPLVRRAAAVEPTIRYVGQIAQRDVVAYATRAILCLMPSRQPEPYGLFAAEVLSAGGRLMHSGRGALAEFSGSEAIRIDKLDTEIWAQAALRLSAESEPRASTRPEGTNSQIPSVERMVDGVEEIYQRALASRSANRM